MMAPRHAPAPPPSFYDANSSTRPSSPRVPSASTVRTWRAAAPQTAPVDVPARIPAVLRPQSTPPQQYHRATVPVPAESSAWRMANSQATMNGSTTRPSIHRRETSKSQQIWKPPPEAERPPLPISRPSAPPPVPAPAPAPAPMPAHMRRGSSELRIQTLDSVVMLARTQSQAQLQAVIRPQVTPPSPATSSLPADDAPPPTPVSRAAEKGKGKARSGPLVEEDDEEAEWTCHMRAELGERVSAQKDALSRELEEKLVALARREAALVMDEACGRDVLSSLAEVGKERARVLDDFKQQMRSLQVLGAEELKVKIEEERQLRLWSAGQNVDGGWSESMVKEQARILENIFKERNRIEAGPFIAPSSSGTASAAA